MKLLSPVVHKLPESEMSSQMTEAAEHTSSPTVEGSVSATFVKNGLQFEIAGSPRALAQFLSFYGEPGTLKRESDSVYTAANDLGGRRP
ncbi:MAG TPA: hypothetical protein VHZ55_18710 [Bryobacteraceae bacterium]|jgi:hypothetical protein|nr:hypothetical protein [Bryobacteraceae bacterium]